MAKSKMNERTTVGSSASANAAVSDSTTVSTFKPHRSKAEILTEIVSDNLIRFACDQINSFEMMVHFKITEKQTKNKI